jgi:hypothetical protein
MITNLNKFDSIYYSIFEKIKIYKENSEWTIIDISSNNLINIIYNYNIYDFDRIPLLKNYILKYLRFNELIIYICQKSKKYKIIKNVTIFSQILNNFIKNYNPFNRNY